MRSVLLVIGLVVSLAAASWAQDPASGAKAPVIDTTGQVAFEIEMKVLEGRDLSGSELRDALKITDLRVPALWPEAKRDTARAPAPPPAEAPPAEAKSRDAEVPRDRQKKDNALEHAVPRQGVTVVAAPRIAVLAKQPATLQQPFSYLVPVADGKSSGKADASDSAKPTTYERKYTAFHELGLTITLEANPVDGADQFVDLSRFEIQVSSLDGRESVEGLEELDVGKPIISKRSLQTTAKIRLGETRVIAIPSGPKTEAVVLLRVTKSAPGVKIDGAQLRGGQDNANRGGPDNANLGLPR